MVLNGGDSTVGNLCGHCLCRVQLINNDIDFSWDMHRQEDYHKYKRGYNLTNSASADTESEIKSDMINWFKSRQHITELAKQLDELAIQQMNQTERNNQVIVDVETVFKKVYPFNFTIKPFGSRITGLTTKDSGDLDLFIDTSGNGKHTMIDSLDVSKMYLQHASSYMKNNQSNVWQNIQEVLNCRTPILTLIHLKTEINCDICVTNSFGNVNTQLMKMYMTNIPPFRPLILMIREWAVYCKLLESRNNINNYALSLLVLFYFQQKKNAPSVNDLEFDTNYQGPVIKINGYNCMDYSLVSFDWKGPQNDPLYDMLLSFFTFYENFDYDNDVICPLLGQPVKKKLFSNNGCKLPREMYAYVEKVKHGGEIFRINERAIHIQDPLDLAHNLTKSSSEDFLWSFVDHCKGSRRALEAIK